MNQAQAAEAPSSITTHDGFVIRTEWLYKGRARLDANGVHIAPDAIGHVQVYDPQSGLVEAINAPGFDQKFTPDESVAAAAELSFAGVTGWDIGDVHEVLHSVDHDFYGPAADPYLYPDAVDALYWTKKETPWSKEEKRAGSARSFFCVLMYDGSVSDCNASLRLRARPVRRAAPASQCLVIGQ